MKFINDKIESVIDGIVRRNRKYEKEKDGQEEHIADLVNVIVNGLDLKPEYDLKSGVVLYHTTTKGSYSLLTVLAEIVKRLPPKVSDDHKAPE